MRFDAHVDGAVRTVPGAGIRMRADLSATLFLTPPDEYGGGELEIEHSYGASAVKLAPDSMGFAVATTDRRVEAPACSLPGLQPADDSIRCREQIAMAGQSAVHSGQLPPTPARPPRLAQLWRCASPRSVLMSREGGAPKKRRYSRLNWAALS